MRRLYVPVALVVLFSLGCGAFGKKEGTDGPVDDDGDGIEQSAVCADYLSCTAAVDADAFAGLAATYGPTAACWSSGQAFADNCSTACQSGVEDLARSFPTEPDCKDYAPDFVMVDGFWALHLELGGPDDDCDVAGAFGDEWTWEGDVENDLENEAFDWDITDSNGVYTTVMNCTTRGADFSCEGGFLTLDGSGAFSTAEGTFTIAGDGCTTSGDFTSELAE